MWLRVLVIHWITNVFFQVLSSLSADVVKIQDVMKDLEKSYPLAYEIKNAYDDQEKENLKP